MDRYDVPQTPLTLALLVCLYLVIIIDRYEVPQTPLIIALLGGIYFIHYNCTVSSATN
jgi:hypothetical protein